MLKELLNQLTGQSNNTANEPKPAAEKKAPVAKNVVATETQVPIKHNRAAKPLVAPRVAQIVIAIPGKLVDQAHAVQRMHPAKALNSPHRVVRTQILPMLRLMRKAQLNRLVPTTVRIIVLTLHVITIAMKKYRRSCQY